MIKENGAEIIQNLKKVQWKYIITSAVVTLILMVIVGVVNIKKLEESYKTTFFESTQAVAKSSIRTLEHGLKYGKSLSSSYTSQNVLKQIDDHISSLENASIYFPDGEIYNSLNLGKISKPEQIKKFTADPTSKNNFISKTITYLSDGTWHQIIPVYGLYNQIAGWLELTFKDNTLRSNISYSTQGSIITILIIILLSTLLLIYVLKKLKTTNDKGELKRALLMIVMSINIAFAQLVFSAINTVMFRSSYLKNTKENARVVSEIIKININNIISKGFSYNELNQVDEWLGSIITPIADIRGVNISLSNQSNSFGYGIKKEDLQKISNDYYIKLALPTDHENQNAELTVVLSTNQMNKRIFDLIISSIIILLASIGALIQVTFITIIIIHRQAIASLDKANRELEQIVADRTKEIQAEKEKSEKLLLNILPKKVADELKQSGYSEPQSFDNVSVFFSDIVGFTDISQFLEPKYLIHELSDIFTEFDMIIEKYQCQRIKTIGDAYLCVSGMPVHNDRHAQNLVNAALDIIDFLNKRNIDSNIKWNIRIGINSGKVVGGIVGVRKYLYDVFGDTINTASRMESNSEPMRINISETTYHLVQSDFKITPRGDFNVKGKGTMKMFFVDGRL